MMATASSKKPSDDKRAMSGSIIRTARRSYKLDVLQSSGERLSQLCSPCYDPSHGKCR